MNPTPASARALAFDNGVLAASVDGFGTWLNGGEWHNTTTVVASQLAIDDGTLTAVFDGFGVWLYE